MTLAPAALAGAFAVEFVAQVANDGKNSIASKVVPPPAAPAVLVSLNTPVFGRPSSTLTSNSRES